MVTPGKRGKGNKSSHIGETEERTPAERRASMTWAQRLKRVFNIDIEICTQCGGPVNVIASIEDPVVINQILDHLKQKGDIQDEVKLPKSRHKVVYSIRDNTNKLNTGTLSEMKGKDDVRIM